MAAHYDGNTLQLEELHRFPNTPVSVRGTLYWNVLKLWSDVQDGIRKGFELKPVGLGVDAWGVDFGLLDRSGELVGQPVYYRDGRTAGMMEEVFARAPKVRVFEHTGTQFMPINTLFQLTSLVVRRSPLLAVADTFLTVPDLLNYWLTGTKVCEFTNATTTQLYNQRQQGWATDLIAALDIPAAIFPEVVPPGTQLGTFEGIRVIAPACHDTGSAVVAIPSTADRSAYISSGTWSLVGLEVAAPVINQASLAANVTNEGGVNGTCRLLKNVMGLWILQQCRGTWHAQGRLYSYGELMQLAATEPSLRSLVPVNDASFLTSGDHVGVVRDLCKACGEPIPDTPGAVVRCVLESLALAYREVLDILLSLTGEIVEVVQIVGGGSQNKLLNQLTANAPGVPVIAGPVEATVLGNAAVQLMSTGALSSLAEARQVIKNSTFLEQYQPQAQVDWQEAYHRYQNPQKATA